MITRELKCRLEELSRVQESLWSLEELRKSIDEIDLKILTIFNQICYWFRSAPRRCRRPQNPFFNLARIQRFRLPVGVVFWSFVLLPPAPQAPGWPQALGDQGALRAPWGRALRAPSRGQGNKGFELKALIFFAFSLYFYMSFAIWFEFWIKM